MKSKTSFFNRTIFKKNVMLYWPIWVCYLLYGLLTLPGNLWSGYRYMSVSGISGLEYLASALSLERDILVAAIAAVITGMALFGYLFMAKSSNMIHALPVTRMELYVTNVTSGLVFLLIPQILVFLLSVIICLCNGVTQVQYLALWLFSMTGATFFFYGLVCFCAMLTGLLFALPVYFVVLNFLSVVLERGTRDVLPLFGYGISYDSTQDTLLSHILSPLDYISSTVYFRSKYVTDARGKEILTSLTYSGENVILGYAAAGVVLYLFSLYCYKKRGVEQTGDLLIFSWIKPIFRWGVGIMAGYFAGIFIVEYLGIKTVGESKTVLYLIVLIGGMLGFFIADMFVQKSFHVFGAGRWKEGGLFALCISASFAVFAGVGYQAQQYIPDEKSVAYAYVEMNYPTEFEGEEISRVIDVHRELLGLKDVFQELCKGQQECFYVNITYCLTDGGCMVRTYKIPVGLEESSALAEEIFGMESETVNFMRFLVGYDYEHITKIEDAQLEWINESENYVTNTLSTECAGKLYEAVMLDADAGRLQKYNIDNYLENIDGTISRYPGAYLTIYLRHPEKNWQDSYQRFREKTQTESQSEFVEGNAMSTSIYVRFGEDCTNIIEALIEEGVIRDKDDLIYN